LWQFGTWCDLSIKTGRILASAALASGAWRLRKLALF
jgi:hypothetical protein